MDVREEIKKALSAALEKSGVAVTAAKVPLEHPGELSHGDYATSSVLGSAKQIGAAPQPLAIKVKEDISVIDGVSKITVAGPGFINFFLSSEVLAESVNKAIETDMWGASKVNEGKKIMVEYTDPNPFKEFHIGHLMSNAIGESISRLLQFTGAVVKRANYQGDLGLHVAKAIWGYQNPDLDYRNSTEVGKWSAAYIYGARAYELGGQFKEQIDALNKVIYEKNDPEVNKLYESGRTLSLAHFEDLYKILGTKFDFYFFESATAPKGAEIVKTHPEVFEESDGAIVYKGEQDGLHTRVFITSKGLPTYETKELGLAELKTETWGFDLSITVTAHEQADYFAVVLAAMRKVLPEVASKIKHVSHGMMRFAEGKMSSRTGNVITGESSIMSMIEAARERATESRAENPEALMEGVGVAAIKYQILKQASGKDIIFDKERALSLEGDSGPYLQYAHARTSAIMEKAKEVGVVAKFDANIEPSELTRLLHRFPEVVERAAGEYEPHLLTTYLLQIASAFNSWYAQEQILDGTPAAAHKVALTDAVRRTLKNGLWILGIPAPEKM